MTQKDQITIRLVITGLKYMSTNVERIQTFDVIG
jgi:hypothetical protein